jgi:hypothetical protein
MIPLHILVAVALLFQPISAGPIGTRSTFSVLIDSTNTTSGSGNIRIQNLGGTVGNNYLTFGTTNAGTFPNDWFYGIGISATDLVFEMLKPPPFSGILVSGTSGGESVWQGTNGAWSTLTVYVVSLEFTPSWSFVQASAPVSYTIP